VGEKGVNGGVRIGRNIPRGSTAREDEAVVSLSRKRGYGIMKKRLFVVWMVTVCLCGAALLLSYGTSSAAEKKEILIGAVNSLTGENVLTAAECKWAYEQAIADVNKKGGIFVKELNKKLPVKLIFADDKSVADGGAAAMERLIKVNHIDLALSSNITPINLAAGTVAEKYKMYYAIATSWLDFVEKENFKYVSDLFTDTGDASKAPFRIWEKLPANEVPKNPALLVEDSQDGQGFGNGFRANAKERGIKFAVDEPFNLGANDFSAQILKYKAAKVDAILTLMSPAQAVVLVRQLKEQGLRIPYLHGWKGFWPREFEKALGKDSNYIIHDGFWNSKYAGPGSEELQQRFIKAFKNDSVSVGLSYANAQILCMAIERAGSLKPEKVRDAVFGHEFKGTVMGDVKYNEKGLAFTPLLAMQWMNGERMPLYPANPKAWTYKPAPPTW
jgi:branched-chain amino acid transport system substrate-binding protein